MKTKDLILSAVVTLNLVLLVAVGAMMLSSGPADESPTADVGSLLTKRAHAFGNASDVAGYFQICNFGLSDSNDAVAVIDTKTDRLQLYITQQGRQGFTKAGDPVDLSRAFQHKR